MQTENTEPDNSPLTEETRRAYDTSGNVIFWATLNRTTKKITITAALGSGHLNRAKVKYHLAKDESPRPNEEPEVLRIREIIYDLLPEDEAHPRKLTDVYDLTSADDSDQIEVFSIVLTNQTRKGPFSPKNPKVILVKGRP